MVAINEHSSKLKVWSVEMPSLPYSNRYSSFVFWKKQLINHLKMESKSLSIQSSNNLLLSEGISKYHSARQVIVEYTSINSIENKRDIQNRTIDLLEDFLAYSYSTPEIEFINSIEIVLNQFNRGQLFLLHQLMCFSYS